MPVNRIKQLSWSNISIFKPFYFKNTENKPFYLNDCSACPYTYIFYIFALDDLDFKDGLILW